MLPGETRTETLVLTSNNPPPCYLMRMNRRVLLLAPLAVAAAAGGGFWAMLRGMGDGSFDPRATGSPLVGHPMPPFSLPDQAPGQGFDDAAIRAAGRPILVNFFASWCQPCLVEHPNLMALKRDGLDIWGIAYKDTSDRARALLARDGNPYARIARDEPGRVAIDWGVTGVPENFLVGRDGVVRWRFAGPLTPSIIDGQLRPALKEVGA